MKFEVITIFPELILDYTKVSIVARGIAKKFISIKAHNLRDFTTDAHKTVDDRPYGGGFGMVLKPDIVHKALKKIAEFGSIGKAAKTRSKKQRVILLTPQGKVFNQAHAKRLAKYEKLIFVCGRYEGFDERVRSMVDEEFSIGDYILMGGELPALVMVEAIARHVPGVVGKEESTINESFSDPNLLEYPQYTRPEVFEVVTARGTKKKMRVPKVLLSGNHQAIEKWRTEEAAKRTQKRRPDLLIRKVL